MKKLLIIALFAGMMPWATAQQVATANTIKVKIEGTVLDSKLLLDKLNNNGQSSHMQFEIAETDYTYRIVFGTFQSTSASYYAGSGGGFNTSSSGAKVFDPSGNELFEFTRANRGTDSGAANAAAKEIIKRIKSLQKLETKEK